MKNFKKIASAIAALSLAACVAVPMSATVFTASAVNVKVTSTDTEEHTYTAYQIFTGAYKTEDGSLTVTGWGQGIKVSDLLSDSDLLELINDVNSEAKLESLTDYAEKADAFARLLEGIINESENANTIARIIGKYVNTEAEAGKATLSATVTNLDAGYWIIVDNYTDTENVTDALSLNILKVTGGETEIDIKTKKEYPSVVKKVQENTDITTSYNENGETEKNYNDVADYNIGDAVPFRLYGTLPSPDIMDTYKTYKYVFNDTLSTNFTLVTGDGDATFDNDDVVVTIGGVTITDGFTVSESGNKITITFDDIKSVIENNEDITLDDNTVVTVSYSAVLNENATIGLNGQENEVYLSYSNNPNYTGEGSGSPTENTPPDKVIVFTYEIDNTKVDAATGDKLSGAKFSIFDSADGGKIAKLKKNTDGTYTITGWENYTDQSTEITGETSEGYVMVTDDDGLFKIKGVDEGTYYLEEVAAPDKYNKLIERVELKLEADTLESEGKDRQAWSGDAKDALTSLKLTVDSGTIAESEDESRGKVENTVENAKGAQLPSTGGIGTTLFYLGGGALVAVAGVMLITKKRMTKE